MSPFKALRADMLLTIVILSGVVMLIVIIAFGLIADELEATAALATVVVSLLVGAISTLVVVTATKGRRDDP